MKVNAHKQIFCQSIHMLFSLALRENKSTTPHAQTFFQSIHMRFSLAPRGTGNNTKHTHTDIFSVYSMCFSLAPCGQVET